MLNVFLKVLNLVFLKFLRFLNCYNPLLKYIQIILQLLVFCSYYNLISFRTDYFSKTFYY